LRDFNKALLVVATHLFFEFTFLPFCDVFSNHGVFARHILYLLQLGAGFPKKSGAKPKANFGSEKCLTHGDREFRIREWPWTQEKLQQCLQTQMLMVFYSILWLDSFSRGFSAVSKRVKLMTNMSPLQIVSSCLPIFEAE
jgi:hypothetical protein